MVPVVSVICQWGGCYGSRFEFEGSVKPADIGSFIRTPVTELR